MTDITIRTEEERDRRGAEIIAREAFWNVYRPGCLEHFVLHRYRSFPDFISELCLVAETGGRLAGQIMWSRSHIDLAGGGRLSLATFGPVSVLPEYQGRGIGARLIETSMAKARAMGIPAVVIEGSPGYYTRFGFRAASDFAIRYAGVPADADASFFMAKELAPGALSAAAGVYCDPPGYDVSEAEADAFDAGFPDKKEKKRLPGQLF